MTKTFVITTAVLITWSFDTTACEAQGIYCPIRPINVVQPAFGPVVYQQSQPVVVQRLPVVQAARIPLAVNSFPIVTQVTRVPVTIAPQVIQSPSYYSPYSTVTVQRPIYQTPGTTFQASPPFVQQTTVQTIPYGATQVMRFPVTMTPQVIQSPSYYSPYSAVIVQRPIYQTLGTTFQASPPSGEESSVGAARRVQRSPDEQNVITQIQTKVDEIDKNLRNLIDALHEMTTN